MWVCFLLYSLVMIRIGFILKMWFGFLIVDTWRIFRSQSKPQVKVTRQSAVKVWSIPEVKVRVRAYGKSNKWPRRSQILMTNGGQKLKKQTQRNHCPALQDMPDRQYRAGQIGVVGQAWLALPGEPALRNRADRSHYRNTACVAQVGAWQSQPASTHLLLSDKSRQLRMSCAFLADNWPMFLPFWPNPTTGQIQNYPKVDDRALLGT